MDDQVARVLDGAPRNRVTLALPLSGRRMGILHVATMKFFADIKTVRGTVTWTRPPWRIRVVQPQAAEPPAAQPAAQEFDEDGRLYVFRYSRTAPQHYQIERDRIFEYMKRRRLPNEGQRQIRRDFRNRADFFADVRDLQTPTDPAPGQ